MKSVAIIVCAWPPQGGGIGNNAYYQAKILAQRGYQVGVFTPDFSGIVLADENYALHNLKTFLHWGKAGFMIGLFSRLKDYSIIHLYYPFFGSDLLIWLYKKRHPQVKLVLHYEMDPIGEGIKKLIFFSYIKLFLGLIIKASDKVAVLSFDHAKNSYLAPYLSASPDKFAELPNGIDSSIFRPLPQDQELMILNNICVQDKVIIFVGGLDRQHYFKGVPILLQAFKKLPQNYFPNVLADGVKRGVLQELRGEAKLIIVGDGDLRAEFESEAKRLEVRDRVIFTGWIKNEDLPGYYSLADVFVLPSTAKTESFGIVVAEAQACGLPAVVSDWPGVRSTIIEGESGLLVKPGDIDDLAEKLKRLLLDDKLRQEFGEAGQSNSVAKYDWHKIVVRMEEIYDNL